MKINSDKYKPIGYEKGGKNILDYKPATSKKYKRIETKLQTGTTVKDIEYKSQNFVSKRKNEKFHRVKVSILNQLLNEETNVESIYQLCDDQENNIDYMNDTTSVISYSNVSICTTLKSEIGSQKVTINQDQNNGQVAQNQAYLLLDIRPQEKFDEFRIRESINFPIHLLKQDKFLPQFYQFKNKKDKIIIIYGFDEMEGIAAGNLFYDKNYDNIFLLSGGIEKFAVSFKDKIDGTLPKEIEKQIFQKKDEKKARKTIMNMRIDDDQKSVNLDICKKRELQLTKTKI